MRCFRSAQAWIACAAAILLGCALTVNSGLAPAQAAATRSAAQEAGAGARPAGCARPAGPAATGPTGRARCYLLVSPAPRPSAGSRAAETCPVNEADGYTPCNLQAAYELAKYSAKDGSHSTVAVVDPYDDPNAASDLAVYRSTYHLAKCGTGNGCFKKVNQDGVAGSYPSPSAGSAEEISLDLDMVSAVCPRCHILLVEANSNGFGDLGTAINEAVSLGATVVSDSWGTGEFDGETSFDSDLDHPGVPITFSSGDGAYQGGVQYPSASPYVTSVGGTELTPASGSRGWTETAWVTPGSPHGIGAFQVPAAPPPAISGVTFSGTVADPTVDVSGTGFGSYPPIGTPETCQPGDTGDDYGSAGLWFSDSTENWTAGQGGDCIGLIVTSWSSTQVVFGFGSEYGTYGPMQQGDGFKVEVQGASFTGQFS